MPQHKRNYLPLEEPRRSISPPSDRITDFGSVSSNSTSTRASGKGAAPGAISTISEEMADVSDALGITPTRERPSSGFINRVPVGSKREPAGYAGRHFRAFSPPSEPVMQEVVMQDSAPTPRSDAVLSPNETLIGQSSPRRFSKLPLNFALSPFSRASGIFRNPFTKRQEAVDQADDIEMNTSFASTEVADETHDDEAFHSGFGQPPVQCSSREDVYQHRRRRLPMTIFLLSIYSTVMSALWLLVAIIQPRWGHKISSKAGLQPSTATLITALIAKTIEISFVTVFVSFLGQVLSRRSLIRNSKGTTLAEITMRNWVIQPGSIFIHLEAVTKAAGSKLGTICVLATLGALFYTSASDALISPKLKFGASKSQELSGYVIASYANVQYVRKMCPSLLKDSDYAAAESCVNAVFSGQSYRNLIDFMGVWDVINTNGTSDKKELKDRPSGRAQLYGNTTVYASWIEMEHSNVTAKAEQTGHLVNNVTMALPHPGVVEAALNPVNSILQPEELSGVGEYNIKAGVVSPAVNVLCVDMSTKDLAPLVYTSWPNANTTSTGVGSQKIGWPGWEGEVPAAVNKTGGKELLNRTSVDDIFRWGPSYGRRPPVFQLLPADFNIITNVSIFSGVDSVYLLSKGGPTQANYTLCEVRSWLSPNCSTHYSVSGTEGSKLEAKCEDPKDPDSYLKSFGNEKPTWPAPNNDWKDLAKQWILSADVNGGTANANASNARILSQLALSGPSLPSYLPSIAEGIAVFAASAVLQGTIGSPFVHYWGFDKPGNILGEPGVLQKFNATVATQEYTSGYTENWKGIFFPILIIVLVLNIMCVFYFLLKHGLVTDFTDPLNLFALALNSPPSDKIQGSCGAGPRHHDLVVPWRVAYAPSANHYFFREAGGTSWVNRWEKFKDEREASFGVKSVDENYRRLSTAKGWF